MPDDPEELGIKTEKKVKAIVATKPPEKEEKQVSVVKEDVEDQEPKKEVKSFKTEYEKRVALQKQQRLKGKIEDRLKSSHR